MIIYEPQLIKKPPNILTCFSAWVGLESILEDIVGRFCRSCDRCIEFGCEYGYSTVALSNFFEKVVAVDTFQGDIHSGGNRDFYQETTKNVEPYNIDLVRSRYQEFILTCDTMFDLAHVDIVHTYNDTFACGEWCVAHSPVVIFHDTVSFPDVSRAVEDLAYTYSRQYLNYPLHYGLGILV